MISQNILELAKNDKDIKGNINKQYKRYNGIFNQRLGTINIKKEDFKKGLSYYMVADKEFDLWPIDKVNNFIFDNLFNFKSTF